MHEKNEIHGRMNDLLGTTPLRDNRTRAIKSKTNDGNATGTATTTTNNNYDVTPWQTVGDDYIPSSNYTNLTPIEESYGNESGGGGDDVSISANNKTTGHNSLATISSHNIKDRTRGREVLLVFSMQGVGIFANSLILTFLLMVSKKSGINDDEEEGQRNNYYNDDNDDAGNNAKNASYTYEPSTLINIWRITYATGAIILLYVLIARIIHLAESEVWVNDCKMREEEKEERQDREMMEYSGARFSPTKLGGAGGGSPLSSMKGWDGLGDSPTLSSLTMKSEFEGLGSTNMDGCKMFPEVIATENSKPSGEKAHYFVFTFAIFIK